jgi:hypothetical protein
MPDSILKDAVKDAVKDYHARAQWMRAVAGSFATIVAATVPPTGWWDMLLRAIAPAAGTAGWVLYRGKFPVVSAAEVRDVIDWWEAKRAERSGSGRRLSASAVPIGATPPAVPVAPSVPAPPPEPSPTTPEA